MDIDYNFVPQIKKKNIKNLVFFSRIHKKKGLLELISIWKNLKYSSDWQLHIYGPISDQLYFKKMISEIKKKNLEKQIQFFKPEFDFKNKINILRNADGFVLPSKSENFGISIGESLANGLPVLTTHQTPWEIINFYKAGYVFDFSIKNIQFNVDKFMSLSDEDRYNMSINAFNLAKDKYDSKKIFLEYEKLYNDLIQ